MARRSAASLALVRPDLPESVQLAPVPDGMSEAEATVWRETVESKPADWFGADSYPVLREYVRAVVMCDDLAAVVARAVKGDDADAVKVALDMRDKESKRMAQLATKLRLTQQSRYTPQAAATADKRASGKRPWQSAG